MEEINMLNQTVLVGRLVKDVEVKATETGKKVATVTLAIPRSYKNTEGEYDTDFIQCVLWNGVAENTAEYCHKGDLIGVKGRTESDTYEKDGETHYVTRVVAEKVTFLSTKKEQE